MKKLHITILLLWGYCAAMGADSTWCAPEETTSINQEFNNLLGKLRMQEDVQRIAGETDGYPITITRPTAICATTNGMIFVGGKNAILQISGKGDSSLRQVTGQVSCLAYENSTLFAGLGTMIAAGGASQHGALLPFIQLKSKSVATALVVTHDSIFVADAGQRLILKYSRDGSLVATFGSRDPARHVDGFVVPSPYFSMAMAPDGLLRVVNPGRHRIEAWTTNGDYEFAWGEAGTALERFCGCCNPAYMALFQDGRFVTSEKGLRRIKVFSAAGKLIGLCCGSRELGNDTDPVPVAVDAQGRILLIDDAQRKVRVFKL